MDQGGGGGGPSNHHPRTGVRWRTGDPADAPSARGGFAFLGATLTKALKLSGPLARALMEGLGEGEGAQGADTNG